jgi:DNA/RNA-binding domain of Phe-tRNA-synthetase-like protein
MGAMVSISVSEDWKRSHPGAIIGLLELSGVDNSRPSAALDGRKREVEARLRADCRGFTRQDFLANPVIAAYDRYYKGFKKTYHVLLQVESIVLKGKDLPAVSPLVDSNFMAEMETFVLTAGHDVSKLRGPVLLDASREGDQIVQMNGASRALYAGDMIMRDADGVSCSVIYGQDNRSPISPGTAHVLYVTYAPAGVSSETVGTDLSRIESHVRLFSPGAAPEQLRLLFA